MVFPRAAGAALVRRHAGHGKRETYDPFCLAQTRRTICSRSGCGTDVSTTSPFTVFCVHRAPGPDAHRGHVSGGRCGGTVAPIARVAG